MAAPQKGAPFRYFGYRYDYCGGHESLNDVLQHLGEIAQEINVFVR
jgi:hypothetical protein